MMDPLQRRARPLATGLVGLVALVTVPMAHVQIARGKASAVTMQGTPADLQGSIALSGSGRYQQREVQPQRVAAAGAGSELGIPTRNLSGSGGPIAQARVREFATDVVHVVVELAQLVHPRAAFSPAGTALAVGIPARGPARQTTAAIRPGETVLGGIPKVTEITLWGTSGKPWVSITASGSVRYQLRNIEPDWVVIDLSKARLALASGRPPAGRGIVKQIRAGQFTQDVVRVVLELAERVPIHVAASPDRAAIVVSFAEAKIRAGAAQARAYGNVQLATNQQPTLGGQAADPHVATGVEPASARPTAPSRPLAVTQPVSNSLVPAAQSTLNPPAAPGAQSGGRYTAGPYLLGPEDVLEVSVWGYPDMTRIVTVRPDGQVAVPLAGTVPAAGRSVERLTQDLTRAFAKYIVNPQVTVIVKDFRKIRVSVLGQVTHPGAYTLPPGGRILDAISMASGATDTAALPEAQLVRASGETRPLNLDGLLLQQDMSSNLVMEPGDTIIIPEDTKNKFYVLGDVNHAGIYPLKGEITVLQALAIAGGPVMHGQSASKTAYIVRRVDPREGPLAASIRSGDVQQIANGGGVLITMDLQKMMRGDLRQNESLRPGDVMVVPAPGAAGLPTILSIIGTILLGLRL